MPHDFRRAESGPAVVAEFARRERLVPVVLEGTGRLLSQGIPLPEALLGAAAAMGHEHRVDAVRQLVIARMAVGHLSAAEMFMKLHRIARRDGDAIETSSRRYQRLVLRYALASSRPPVSLSKAEHAALTLMDTAPAVRLYRDENGNRSVSVAPSEREGSAVPIDVFDALTSKDLVLRYTRRRPHQGQPVHITAAGARALRAHVAAPTPAPGTVPAPALSTAHPPPPAAGAPGSRRRC